MPFVCTLSIDRLRFCLFLRGNFALTLALTRQPVALSLMLLLESTLFLWTRLHPALCQWALKTSHNSSLPWNRIARSIRIASTSQLDFLVLGWAELSCPSAVHKLTYQFGTKDLKTQVNALQMSWINLKLINLGDQLRDH